MPSLLFNKYGVIAIIGHRRSTGRVEGIFWHENSPRWPKTSRVDDILQPSVQRNLSGMMNEAVRSGRNMT
jgi:hypothetical protein